MKRYAGAIMAVVKWSFFASRPPEGTVAEPSLRAIEQR